MQKENALTNSFREINDYYIIIAVGTDRSVINKSECCDNATDNHEFVSTQDVVWMAWRAWRAKHNLLAKRTGIIQ